MEILAASHLVENERGDTFTVFEIWRSAGWFRLACEVELKLAGGELVGQLASNVFVVANTNELLFRKRLHATADCIPPKSRPERIDQCAEDRGRVLFGAPAPFEKEPA